MKERLPELQLKFIDKGRPTFDKVQVKLDNLHRLKQEIDDDMSLLCDSVELNIKFDEPVRIIPISDTHLFAVQTDTTKANELLGKLRELNTFGIIMGDFIEGANPKIVDHINNVEIGFTQQVIAAKKIIEPFVKTGKIICMVGTFTGHEGWGDTTLGLDVVQLIAHGFSQPDGTDLKVLYNGGKLIIHLNNGVTYSQLIYHAPGGGGSDEINPLGAQRNRLWEHISHRGPTDGAGGGDWHHRAGVSKETVFDLKDGKERSHLLFSNGTSKGNDPNRPDTFLTKMAKGPTLAPGVQLILNQPARQKNDGRNGEYAWLSYGFNKGEILYEAAKLLDKTEKQKKTGELIEEIIDRSRKPKAEFDRKSSRTKIKDNQFDTPMFENFKWKFEDSGSIPRMVFLLAGARYSSTSFEKRDKEKLFEIVKQIESNPFQYGLVMRHFIDPDVAKMYSRDYVLDRMINDLSPIVNKDRLLGFMMSSSLLDDRWKKDVLGNVIKIKDSRGKIHFERERKSRLYPGTYIYRAFSKKVPLYLNQSLMYLDFGKASYEFLLMDHLANSGSEFDPFRGLVQARRKALLRSDVVAGGHMLGGGFMTTPDADYVAPGWFSEYDSGGKSNKKRAPLGGQAVILFPDQKLVIPTSTLLESVDTHEALILLKGLRKEEKEKIMSKKVR
ncbi:MAG: hypothetical protein UT58_C0003G0010 [Microgenomates group bacterium GW2011_GWC1_39_7b]|uniref:Uncharacterized protein n=3 Tax=Candidatus Woeseibacteriota TaxID=1752722 RepID=A0A0G0P289_9BACT|nr:MAG: hypothetical protein UT17_C0003G0232 [Candidatus Woesebacteria bacterium GW2011_GWB1_39_10]KKR26932.1 MAG: hypothetical protein UT58_C0003G0010 [Microgenomates group bacterium GW2011_GWC1_39_7b]KKR72940.1 MAG: hypothetical protein UU16_C0035G0021 [Candidatus Woesebacteria bacterium GW2011_GWA2_40_7]KKS91169.1 MAG: hypothetical protein UV66_C0001G0526 [Candidatus Woesebacteria bacterium GW2011_GWA1_43_12]